MGTAQQGAISEEAKTWIEEWENVSAITNFIIRLDARGEERPEQISGSKVFKLTTEERILTQDKIVDKKHDPFLNGCFRPVTVPDTVDVETNPNALSDADIDRILRSSQVAWEEYLKVVDSPATLRRMLGRFEALLDDGEDLSARRLRQLEDRLEVVSPRTRVTQKDRQRYESIGGEPQPTGRPSMRSG